MPYNGEEFLMIQKVLCIWADNSLGVLCLMPGVDLLMISHASYFEADYAIVIDILNLI